MSIYRTRSRTKQELHAVQDQPQDIIMERLRCNAGIGATQRRDPVFALSESFAQTFDLVGRQSVQQTVEGRAAAMRGASMLPWIADDGGQFLRRFSEHAFQNGRLAAAILQGQGTVALHACVERAQGWAGRTRTEQGRRIDQTAGRDQVPYTDDWVHAGGDVHAAVALVISATHTATQVLLTVQRAAEQLGEKQNLTLRELFPFLFEEEDQELIQRLRQKQRQMQKIGDCQSTQYRAIVRALDKANAVLAKKRQMRREFLAKVETLLANARTAEQLFAQENMMEISRNLHKNFINNDERNEESEDIMGNDGEKAGDSARKSE